MRIRHKHIVSFVMLVLMVSCTEQQMQNLKQGAPDLLASIAAGWGGQYAGLVSSFTNVLKGGQYSTDVA